MAEIGSFTGSKCQSRDFSNVEDLRTLDPSSFPHVHSSSTQPQSRLARIYPLQLLTRCQREEDVRDALVTKSTSWTRDIGHRQINLDDVLPFSSITIKSVESR